MGHKIANLLIACITLWAICVVAAYLLGVTVSFPLDQIEHDEISYHRLCALRLAIFGTFAFYGLMHLLKGSKHLYPIHFLKTFLFSLSIFGVLVGLRYHTDMVKNGDWYALGFWFLIATALHFLSLPRFRRYFRKKN
tara:strand:+ start:86 stop:496 length:411 start_codon:yes stop_codon:yes gene_type:complete